MPKEGWIAVTLKRDLVDQLKADNVSAAISELIRKEVSQQSMMEYLRKHYWKIDGTGIRDCFRD